MFKQTHITYVFGCFSTNLKSDPAKLVTPLIAQIIQFNGNGDATKCNQPDPTIYR